MYIARALNARKVALVLSRTTNLTPAIALNLPTPGAHSGVRIAHLGASLYAAPLFIHLHHGGVVRPSSTHTYTRTLQAQNSPKRGERYASTAAPVTAHRIRGALLNAR